MEKRSRKAYEESIYNFAPRRLKELDAIIERQESQLNLLIQERDMLKRIVAQIHGDDRQESVVTSHKDSTVAVAPANEPKSRAESKVVSEVMGSNEPPTIKAMALAVLQANPQGLTNRDVAAEMLVRFNKSVGRTSLSPQINRLNKAGVIKKSGDVWVIAQSASLAEVSA
jgi:hypothetical protein